MSMFVALGPCGQLTTIADAVRGLACDCTCVSCGESVIARKGLIREHHFSHHSGKQSCFIQRESLLHLYAKEVIRNHLGLQLPPLPGTFPESEDKTSWWDFERVDEKVPQQGSQPDLVACLRDGTQLFIEVAVTSFIGEKKLTRVEKAGIPTVEINLRELLLSGLRFPSNDAKAYVLNRTHNKSWIYSAPRFAPTVASAGWPTTQGTIRAADKLSYIEHRFNVTGMWVSARILQSGSVAVRSWSFNPQIVDLLRSWREDLGGVYNPKYRNWIFPPASQEEILNRLRYLDQ